MKLLRGKVGRTAGYSMLLRFALKLIAKRLNVLKALKEPVPILQFGIATGIFNLVFHIIRRLFAVKRKRDRDGKKESSGVLS